MLLRSLLLTPAAARSLLLAPGLLLRGLLHRLLRWAPARLRLLLLTPALVTRWRLLTPALVRGLLWTPTLLLRRRSPPLSLVLGRGPRHPGAGSSAGSPPESSVTCAGGSGDGSPSPPRSGMVVSCPGASAATRRGLAIVSSIASESVSCSASGRSAPPSPDREKSAAAYSAVTSDPSGEASVGAAGAAFSTRAPQFVQKATPARDVPHLVQNFGAVPASDTAGSFRWSVPPQIRCRSHRGYSDCAAVAGTIRIDPAQRGNRAG